jgi:hypothetical protein
MTASPVPGQITIRRPTTLYTYRSTGPSDLPRTRRPAFGFDDLLSHRRALIHYDVRCGIRHNRATALVEYHVRRNEAARKSDAKTWQAKHRRVKFLRL